MLVILGRGGVTPPLQNYQLDVPWSLDGLGFSDTAGVTGVDATTAGTLDTATVAGIGYGRVPNRVSTTAPSPNSPKNILTTDGLFSDLVPLIC